MNEDLRWLAENEPQWAMDDPDYLIVKKKGKAFYINFNATPNFKNIWGPCNVFTRPQWQAARDELEEEKEKLTMHEDLKWLAENVTEWHNKLDRIARQPYGPHWFDQNRFPHWEGFTRAQWQAARDEMSKQGEPSTKANAQLLAERLSYAQFLAEKLPYWRGDYTHCSWIFEGDGGEGAEWPRFNYGQGCSREDWQAAHDELYMSKTDSCHESPLDYAEEESPIDAFERECKQDSANSTFSSPDEEEAWAEAEKRMDSIGPTGEHYDEPASKYHVLINGKLTDVYDILVAYRITNPADQHALKKMLKPGQRGSKDGIQDRREAIVSLQRAIELECGE